MHSYHSLGRVLRDAGFRFPPLIESIPEGGRMDVSAERLPELMPILFLQPGAVTPVVNLRMSWQQWKSHAGMVSVSDCLSFRALCADLS